MRLTVFFVVVMLVGWASCQLDEQPQGETKGWGKSSNQTATENASASMQARISDCFKKVFLGKEAGQEPKSEQRMSVDSNNQRSYQSSSTSGRVVVEGIDYWGEKFEKIDIDRIETCECLVERKIRIGTTNAGKPADETKELQFLFGSKQGKPDEKLFTVGKEEGYGSLVEIVRVPNDEMAMTEEKDYSYCKLKITITSPIKDEDGRSIDFNITKLLLKKQYGNIEVIEE